MANKRMFSKDIVCSDKFRLMPLSSQSLYFHLSMEADDRGYVDNAYTLIRAIGANQGDLEILIQKKFILIRDDLILIKGWKINNYIQKDRFTETKYIDDLKKLYYDENYSYTTNKTDRPCLRKDLTLDTGMDTVLDTGLDTPMDTQDRLGKVRIDKNRIDNKKKVNKENEPDSLLNEEYDKDEFNKMIEEMGG